MDLRAPVCLSMKCRSLSGRDVGTFPTTFETSSTAWGISKVEEQSVMITWLVLRM